MYDIIIIGTSPISILEAVHRNRNGEKVLMIDKNKIIGGAWSSLKLFDIENVENAIHYFLPNMEGINFLKNKLELEITESKLKFRIFKIPFLGYFKMHYDNIFSRVLDKIINKSLNWQIIKDSFLKKQTSYYFKNGSSDLIKKVDKLLADSNVEVILNCKINKFLFNDKKISVFTNNDKNSFESKKVIFTNGSRLKNIYNKGRKIDIVEKFQSRPAVHLLVEDSSSQKVVEGVFVKDSLIKYVHEVSYFARGNLKNRKIFILALKHHIIETKDIYNNILNKLKKAQICSLSSSIIDTKWSDVILPTLFNEDLEKLKKQIGEKRLFTIETESFLEAIETNSKRWTNLK